MKNVLSFIALIIVVNGFAQAQTKITQGKITMVMTSLDSVAGNKDKAASNTGGMVVYFKGSLSRTEMNTQMGDMIMIYNGKTGENITCMDMGGKKVAMKSNKKQINEMRQKRMENKPVVKLVAGTKMLCGFKCRKAEITYSYKGKLTKTITWYTNDIVPAIMKDDALESIDGYALETTSVKGETQVKISCKSFEKITVPDSMFKIPAGYKEMDMSQMMQGGKK